MRNKFKAMTLVELVVYLALFGVIFLSIMQFVMATNQNNDTARGRNLIEKNTVFILRHLEQAFSSVQSIDEINSIFDIDQGKLVLNTNDGIKQYQLSGTKLEYNYGGSDFDLVQPGFEITSFKIEKILNNDDQLVGVIISITMDSINLINVSKNISTSFLIK